MLRHVIIAMPVYHFMSMSLNSKSYKMLEGVSRNFLWGKRDGGHFKKALIVWDKMAVSRAEGGLGFETFQDQSLVLKMRWCGKLLMEYDLLWVKLAIEGIKRTMDNRVGCRT